MLKHGFATPSSFLSSIHSASPLHRCLFRSYWNLPGRFSLHETHIYPHQKPGYKLNKDLLNLSRTQVMENWLQKRERGRKDIIQQRRDRAIGLWWQYQLNEYHKYSDPEPRALTRFIMTPDRRIYRASSRIRLRYKTPESARAYRNRALNWTPVARNDTRRVRKWLMPLQQETKGFIRNTSDDQLRKVVLGEKGKYGSWYRKG